MIAREPCARALFSLPLSLCLSPSVCLFSVARPLTLCLPRSIRAEILFLSFNQIQIIIFFHKYSLYSLIIYTLSIFIPFIVYFNFIYLFKTTFYYTIYL